MPGWLPHNRSSSVMAERSFSESEPAATSSEAPALHRNRLDVRGPEVKVRVNIGSDFGLLSHAYEFRVHDMAQWLDRWDVDAVKKCSNLSQRATGFPIPSSTRQGRALASNIPALGTVAV